MATAHNPKDIFFEHEMAVQEEDAERAAERESAHDIDWEALDKLTDAMSDMVLQNINEKFQKSIFGIIIEKSVKVLLKDSGLFNGYESTDIDEKILNEALLLCDMMTI